MSDRTSAGIYGGVFELLASDPTDQHKEWALRLWKASREHDFSPDQMGVDKALKTLDLAVDDPGGGRWSALYRKYSGDGYGR